MCDSDPKVQLGKEADRIMKAFVANYPQMANVVGQSYLPLSQAELAASKATYPELQKLGITSDLNTIQGPGSQLLDQALALEQKANPEFYGTRTATSNALGKLYDSVDLSGALSGGERAEIERSVNRQNIGDGIKNPTPLSTIENAMQFGQASNAKRLQQQGILTGAVNAGTQFLPASKSNIDPFQIATGRASQVGAPGGVNSGNALGGATQNTMGQASGNVLNYMGNSQSGFEKFMGSMPSYSG